MTSPNAYPHVPVIVSGLKATCPRCGKGPLFRQVLNLRDDCPWCAMSYKFMDTGDGPAIFAIFILGFVVLGAALWVEFTYEPSLWVHLILWGIVTPLLAIGLLRFLKATLIALQYRDKAEEGRLVKD